jgi:RNase P/RNase MRP subunit p30
LARLAKKNEVSLGINLEEIFTSDSFKEKSDVIARIKQNIKLCSKYKIKVVFFAERRRDLYDLKALCLVLGMPTYLTKEIKFYNLNNIKN